MTDGQWNSVTDAYRTFSLNAEYKAPVGQGSDFVTTGFQLLHDQSGTIGWGTSYLRPTLNYHKSLSDYKNSYLSLGFMGGFVQHRFDISKMTTNSSYENGGAGTGENFPNTQYGYFNGSVGMSYNGDLSSNNAHSFFLGYCLSSFHRAQRKFLSRPCYPDDTKMGVQRWP